jgi:hypothetical protein
MAPFVDDDHEVEDQDDLQEEDEEAENLTESAERGKPSHGKRGKLRSERGSSPAGAPAEGTES